MEAAVEKKEKSASLTPPKDDTIKSILEKSRRSLLDLSLRNRLLSIPKKSRNARIVHIHDELSSEVLRILYEQGKTMSLLAGKDKEDEEEQGDLGFGHSYH